MASGTMRSYDRRPPLRQAPDAPDMQDTQRVAYVKRLWHSQDDVLRMRDRHVEENIRMICGQQYNIWNPLLQRFVDVNHWMTEDERRWRQRPVFNWLLYWFMLTHARLTENPPIITFQPASADRLDAMLAETMDPIFKMIWARAGMLDVNDELMAWLIPCGTAYALSRIDPTLGEMIPWIGEGEVPMVQDPANPESRILDQFGQPIMVPSAEVPFDQQGNPTAVATPDGQLHVLAPPHMEPEGQIVVDVLSPLQCRGEWGPRPWHRKAWHQTLCWMSCEEIYDLWNIEVQPESSDISQSGIELQRMLFGSGYYGASGGRLGSEGIVTNTKEGFAKVYSLTEKPCDAPGYEAGEGMPGGRHLIVVGEKVAFDGQRAAAFQHTSPIQKFSFVKVPGRAGDTTPQEALNPLQRIYNRGWAQILEHRNISCNPIGIIDDQSNIREKDITNKPGRNLKARQRQGVPAFSYVAPPRLSEDVWRSQKLLIDEFTRMAHIEGSEGMAPTRDASGELTKELRYNSDRPYGPTSRRNVEAYARVVEDWMVMLPLVYPKDKILTIPGDDNVISTLTVYPEIFQLGRVNVTPDIESMLPEGRGERQGKIDAMYDRGIFGPIGSPGAVKRYLELFRHPHLSRAAMPGSVHFQTARRELAKLAMGDPSVAQLNFPWYDQMIHLEVIQEHMAAPEFLAYPPEIQQLFTVHWEMHAKEVEKQMKAQQAEQERLMKAEAAAKGGGGDKGPPQAENAAA